jgi:hypothetical protein
MLIINWMIRTFHIESKGGAMKVIKSEMKLCLLCMEEHVVETVEVSEHRIYKDEEVSFTARYEYCSTTENFLETEELIKANSLTMKMPIVKSRVY